MAALTVSCRRAWRDTDNGEPPAVKVPVPSAAAGATPFGSGIISESDVGSLGSSSIDVPGPIPGATGAISGPSTDSSSERSITGIGSLSGMISLREYEDDDGDLTLIACLKSNVSNLVSNLDALIPPVMPPTLPLGQLRLSRASACLSALNYKLHTKTKS
ncbi:hypothetical protein M9H77_06053 [Catharanthus roseus]|uniref:Uncharacterized protein n=1 Tax=Catharanthus roseus TaxID=4058 RepID=A0ACC0BRC9_CATRO|nr:hypothetical protein M9H77_06053 [Catharanthus roseus]